MQIYYFLFVLLVALICIPCTGNNKIQNYNSSYFIFHAMFLVLFVSLFFGLRNVNLGLDSIQYLKMFRSGKFDDRSQGEIGFALLIKLLHNILTFDKSFLFVMSFIISFLCFYLYKEIDKQHAFYYFLILSCFYYFYIFHMSMYRNGIAIGLLGISYLKYKKDDKLSFYFLGILAFSIHYTAIIFLIFPILDRFCQKKITNRKRHTLLFIVLLIFLFTSIMDKIVAAIPEFCFPILRFKDYYLRGRYYWQYQFHITHSHLITLSIMLFFNFNFNKIKQSKFFNLYLLHSIYYVLIALFKNSVVVYDRFYFYIQVFEPVLIFEFYNIFKEKKLAKFLIITLTILYSVFTIFLWGPRNLIKPYYL